MIVVSGMPVTPTVPAVACRVFHLRLPSSLSVAVANPKLTSLSVSPAAFVVPPLTPAKAEAFWPPIMRTSAAMDVPSESETLRVLVWTPKDPVTLKKSATPIVASVATLRSAPLLAGCVMVTVEPSSMRTLRGLAWKSTRELFAAPPVAVPSDLLSSTAKLVAEIVRSGSPTSETALPVPAAATQRRLSAESLGTRIAIAPSTPATESPVASEFEAGPLTPAKTPPSREFMTMAQVSTVVPSLSVAVYSIRLNVRLPLMLRKSKRLRLGRFEIWR